MKKYIRGGRYTNIHSVVADLLDGKCIYWNDKCQNAAWLMNNSLHVLNRATAWSGILFHAIKLEDI